MTELELWKSELEQELEQVDYLYNGVKGTIEVFLSSSFKKDNHIVMINKFVDFTKNIETLISSHNNRSLLLARYFDKAHKESTLVLDNYEKMEECIEVAKNEYKEIFKKICSFSTLEMDYHEKLLKYHNKEKGEDYLSDFNSYRQSLNQVHRFDQIQIFKTSVLDMIVTLKQVIHKFISILDNKDNMNEIKKLWQKRENISMY